MNPSSFQSQIWERNPRETWGCQLGLYPWGWGGHPMVNFLIWKFVGMGLNSGSGWWGIFQPLLLGCDKQEARGWESEIAVLYAKTRKPQWLSSQQQPAAVLSPWKQEAPLNFHPSGKDFTKLEDNQTCASIILKRLCYLAFHRLNSCSAFFFFFCLFLSLFFFFLWLTGGKKKKHSL